MSIHITTITEQGIENQATDLEFDHTRIFGSGDFRQIQESTNNVRHLIIQEDHVTAVQSIGYTHKLEFALEIVKQRFSTIMKNLKQEQGASSFIVKIERPENETSNCPLVIKLYQPGYVYGRRKLMTITIKHLPRLEFPKNCGIQDGVADK